MVYLILAIPPLLAAGMVAAGMNPWASFAAGYVLHVFILRGFAAED